MYPESVYEPELWSMLRLHREREEGIGKWQREQ